MKKPYSYQDYITEKKVMPLFKCNELSVQNPNNPTTNKPIYCNYTSYIQYNFDNCSLKDKTS